MNIISQAALFSANAHTGQLRKYTNEPYATHPFAVAGLVAAVTDNKDTIAAAFLHDVVEDCGVHVSYLAGRFGDTVAEYVHLLTNATHYKGNRSTRKQIDLERLATAPPEVQTIKLADLIDNTKTIVALDPKFSITYMAEKRDLLTVLTAGAPSLLSLANQIVNDFYNEEHHVKTLYPSF